MIVKVSGEVMNISETDNGRIYEVLHQSAQGKEVLKVYYTRTNKKTGEPRPMPELKVGNKFEGVVKFNGLCFPA